MRNDLLRATETVVGLSDDVLAPPSHQAEPVVPPVLLDAVPLQPAGPPTLAQVTLHVSPPSVKTLRPEHLQEEELETEN